jgi:hypothetical protein
VFRQPTTPEETALCLIGVDGCPTEAVGADGDKVQKFDKKRATILTAAWVIILIGGVAGYWWLQYGSWRLHGHTLEEHDEVLFGPASMFLFTIWILSFFAALVASLRSW